MIARFFLVLVVVTFAAMSTMANPNNRPPSCVIYNIYMDETCLDDNNTVTLRAEIKDSCSLLVEVDWGDSNGRVSRMFYNYTQGDLLLTSSGRDQAAMLQQNHSYPAAGEYEINVRMFSFLPELVASPDFDPLEFGTGGQPFQDDEPHFATVSIVIANDDDPTDTTTFCDILPNLDSPYFVPTFCDVSNVGVTSCSNSTVQMVASLGPQCSYLVQVNWGDGIEQNFYLNHSDPAGDLVTGWKDVQDSGTNGDVTVSISQNHTYTSTGTFDVRVQIVSFPPEMIDAIENFDPYNFKANTLATEGEILSQVVVEADDSCLFTGPILDLGSSAVKWFTSAMVILVALVSFQ